MVLMSISLSTRSILMSSISNSYDRKVREEIFSSLFLNLNYLYETDHNGVGYHPIHCFYTGHNDYYDTYGLDKECVLHATSKDNKSFTKDYDNIIHAPKGYST